MADITLHSGSFVDRNNDEISIKFFKRTSTPQMIVQPESLSYIAAGETKTLTVRGWAGTLRIGVPALWLNYTETTISGVRTYRLTATQNNTTTVRRTTVTLMDDNTNIFVDVVQAGTASSIVINPSYITLQATGGQTVTSSLSWSGGTTPTFTGKASWVNLTTSTSGNTMTLTVSALDNTGEDRTNEIVFSNGISSATLHITQNAASVLYLSTNMLSYEAEGGLWQVTAYWTGDVTPTYTINYASGSGWLSQRGDPVSGGTRELTWTFRADANSGTSVRNATIVFTTGNVSATVDVTQAGTVAQTISVNKTEINNVSPAGATDVVTVTYSGQGYITPSCPDSWITVRYKDAPTTTTVRYDIIIADNPGTPRSATITFTGSLGGTATTTVNQSQASVPWDVSPASLQNVSYLGDTFTLTFVGTPSVGMRAEVIPNAAGSFVSVTVDSMTQATVTVTENNLAGTVRTADIYFYKMDDSSTYLQVPMSQNARPVPWAVVPSVIDNATAAGLTYRVNIAGAPEGGMSYDVDYESGNNWITITNFTSTGCSLTTSANSSTSSRDATVKYIDQDDVSHYITTTVHQYGQEADPLYVTASSLSFAAEGGKHINPVDVYNIVGTLTTTQPSWITLAMSGEGSSRTVSVTAASNSLSTSRSGSVLFDDDRQSPVSMAVEQAGFVAQPMTVNPSSISASYIFYSTNLVRLSNVVGNVSIVSKPAWVSYTKGEQVDDEAWYYINLGRNTTYEQRSGTVTFMDEYSTADLPVSQGSNYVSDSITTSTSTLRFNATDANVTQAVRFYNVDTQLVIPSIPESWLSVTSGSKIDETTWDLNVTVKSSNTYTSSRYATVDIKDYYPRGTVTLAITQYGTGGETGISVSPSELNFSYTSSSATLTVSRVGSYSTSLSYNTGASGWLSVLSNANTITVAASGTTYPSSRSATLTVTNGSDAYDRAYIPITQAGNPGVLSVTPNAWNYPSSLSYHEFTVTYVSTGEVDYEVHYDRQPGEEEIDWLEVGLVDHEEGTETWTFSIDVGPNNTGSGRAAMVTFTGDGGGADEVSVYQQP